MKASKKMIDELKHLISLSEKALKESTEMYEKYGEEIDREVMEFEEKSIALYKKWLDEDLKDTECGGVEV